MKKRNYTLLLIPDKTSTIKKFKMPSFLIQGSLAILMVLLIVFFISLYDYINLKIKITELNVLKKLTEKQKKEINLFSSKVSSIEKELLKLKKLESMIRDFAKFGVNNKELPVGGPTFKDSQNISKFEKKGSLLMKDIDRLGKEVVLQNESFEELHKLIENQIKLLSVTPSIYPTKGWISSKFGDRESLFTNSRKLHEGIDIATWFGTPVVAPANGIVSYAGEGGSYGKLLIISHGFGITTRYGHLSNIFVKTGQKVKKGEKIATVGNTGKSTGPHLHYEVRVNSIPVNPERYIVN